MQGGSERRLGESEPQKDLIQLFLLLEIGRKRGGI